MPSGFTNKPKILRGAFVEYGLSLPPLVVVFQFNPLTIERSRKLTFSVPGESASTPRSKTLHQTEADLRKIQECQDVKVPEEIISFDIRLDATDKLNEGDAITGEFGVGPRLATLELMMHPKGESILGGLVDDLLGLDKSGFSFTKKPNPPMILFIWGIKRVLPVNITSMNITETQFNTNLDPMRATVSVNLTVIEGENPLYMYSKAVKEVTSVLNLANIADIANVVIPG